MTNPSLLKPSEWAYEASLEALVNQARMLALGIKVWEKIPGVQDLDPGEEAMTPWGMTLKDFDFEARRCAEAAGWSLNLEQSRNRMSELCGYSNYTHMVSLSVQGSEFWSSRYAGKVCSDRAKISVFYRDFLKAFVEKSAILLGRDSAVLWKFPIDYLEPFTSGLVGVFAIEIPSTAWCLKDIDSDYYQVECGQSGQTGSAPFVVTLPVDSMRRPDFFGFFAEEIEEVGKEFAQFGGVSYTVPYSLQLCQAELEFEAKPEFLLFDSVAPRYAEQEVFQVYEHNEPDIVVIVLTQLNGNSLAGYKVNKENWLAAVEGWPARPDDREGVQKHLDEIAESLSFLMENSEESWQSPGQD